MQKNLIKRFLILMAVLLILSPFVMWKVKQETAIDVWVVDKTVPVNDYREHKGLFWIFNYEKITNQLTSSPFNYKKDYYGYHPIGDTFEIRNIPETSITPDLIYLADTYGVYTDDLKKQPEGERSEKIYGGLTLEEIALIKQNLNNNVLIAEFNTLGSPTPIYVRRDLEDVLGVRWSGWIGRFFKDLNDQDEIPSWMRNTYEKQHAKKWTFTGEGYILVSEHNEIEVLEKGTDFNKASLKISFSKEYQKEFGISSSVDYDYWFEWMIPSTGTETLANYHLALNPEGEKKLAGLGLDSTFPAVLRKSDFFTSYYFAGDFADYVKTSFLYQYKGMASIKKYTQFHIPGTNNTFYWKTYVPLMQKILDDIRKNQQQKYVVTPEINIEDGIHMISRTSGPYMQIYRQGQWQDLPIKGINIGIALPGKWFTDFPASRLVYMSWFEHIGNMNANTLRIYTLLDPEFYKSLLMYNQTHPENPLYLMQGLWPEEHPPEDNLLDADYMKNYVKEIQLGIDAIHGTAEIPERKGRAYGSFTADVSPYVIAYLPGRELEPQEIISTDKLNPGYRFSGEYFGVENGSPSESFCAWICNTVLEYEQMIYAWERPVAIVSWPTLDPLQHDSEWNIKGNKSLEYNDKVSIDINHIDSTERVKAGLFGAYHIYPNYPDFMNNEPSYDKYNDQEGRLRYGGYLRDFINQHKKYPALVAEFGLATGMGNAHYNPDGYHHGGMTETEQGEGTVRMMKAILEEGYMGGIIFEWMDEWAKKTWTTEPFMIPYEKHVFWHNALCPEQNYGLLAMEAIPPTGEDYVLQSSGLIEKVEMKANESYLFIDVYCKEPINWSNQEILIGLDTVDSERGAFRFPTANNNSTPTGMEFMIILNGPEDGLIKVIPEYNTARYNYSTQINENAVFEEINPIINKARIHKDGTPIEERREDASHLRWGNLEIAGNQWFADTQKISLKIPWGRINVCDPLAHGVIDDQRPSLFDLSRDMLQTTETEGIRIYIEWNEADKNIALLPGEKSFVAPPVYKWDLTQAPRYQMRLKDSYHIIREYFRSF